MRKSKTVVLVSAAFILLGLTLMFYGAFWWAFVGGIVDLIDAVKAPETVALDVGLAIGRMFLTGPLMALGAIITLIGIQLPTRF